VIVVADTSAISNLMAIGREGILRDLFGEVLVPPAVERELLDWHCDLPAILDELISVAEFHLSAEVKAEFLQLAGEDGGGGLHPPGQP
jgi:predicted nucleic acid-binding protein